MKTLITFLFILSTTFTHSQEKDVYTDEWYEKLDSDLEYIMFPNPNKGDELNIRVYRGNDENHAFRITNVIGETILNGDIKREDEIDVSLLNRGTYFLTISNGKKNLTQILFIN